MLEEAERLWIAWTTEQGAVAWPEDDPRHLHSAEVRRRLRQVAHVVRRVREWQDRLSSSGPTDEQVRAWLALVEEAQEQGRELTADDHAEVFGPPGGFPGLGDWEDIAVWAESFYYFAWRLLKALKAFGFAIQAPGVRFVRNQLIEHPENHPDRVHPQSMVVTSDGPVLRHAGAVVVRSATGESVADEAMDRGLFINAEELSSALEAALREALESNDGGAT